MIVHRTEFGIRFERESLKEWFMFRVSPTVRNNPNLFFPVKGYRIIKGEFEKNAWRGYYNYYFIGIIPFVIMREFFIAKYLQLAKYFISKKMLDHEEGYIVKKFWFFYLHLPKK